MLDIFFNDDKMESSSKNKLNLVDFQMKLITEIITSALALVSFTAPALSFGIDGGVFDNTPFDTDTWADTERDVREWNGSTFGNTLEVESNCDEYIFFTLKYWSDGEWYEQPAAVSAYSVTDMGYAGDNRYAWIDDIYSDNYSWDDIEIDFGGSYSNFVQSLSCG